VLRAAAMPFEGPQHAGRGARRPLSARSPRLHAHQCLMGSGRNVSHNVSDKESGNAAVTPRSARSPILTEPMGDAEVAAILNAAAQGMDMLSMHRSSVPAAPRSCSPQPPSPPAAEKDLTPRRATRHAPVPMLAVATRQDCPGQAAAAVGEAGEAGEAGKEEGEEVQERVQEQVQATHSPHLAAAVQGKRKATQESQASVDNVALAAAASEAGAASSGQAPRQAVAASLPGDVEHGVLDASDYASCPGGRKDEEQTDEACGGGLGNSEGVPGAASRLNKQGTSSSTRTSRMTAAQGKAGEKLEAKKPKVLSRTNSIKSVVCIKSEQRDSPRDSPRASAGGGGGEVHALKKKPSVTLWSSLRHEPTLFRQQSTGAA